MNAIIFFVMTALLPTADFLWKAKQTGMLGMMIQSLTNLSHSPDFLALCGVGVILALLINWGTLNLLKSRQKCEYCCQSEGSRMHD